MKEMVHFMDQKLISLYKMLMEEDINAELCK